MTEVIEPARVEPAGSLAEALDDVRRSAQQLLADVGHQPKSLRIRAGDVLVELEWPGGGTVAVPSVSIVAEERPQATVDSGHFDICAPTVGTFYRAPEPGAAPFVTEGDLVKKGQPIGIVEAMKLMIPVEAEQEGRVVAVHVADGSPVEYGDRLCTLGPACG